MRASDHQHAIASRSLWQAVAVAAITDAAKDILQADKRMRDTFRKRTIRYFRSKDWQEVCTLSGISYKPDRIEEYLLSDRLQGNIFNTYRLFEVREPGHR